MPPSPIQALFQQALALHRAGRLAEAETAYRQIMRADPRDYPSRCMLGRLRLEQGKPEEAAKILEQAVKIDGRSPPGLAIYGLALLRLRKFGEAAAMLERAAAAAPESAANWRNLGDALRGGEKFEAALPNYDKALAIDPRSAEPWACRGDALLALGRYEAALADADRALSLHAGDKLGLIVRARALAALERDEALDAHTRAIAAAPEEWLLRRNRGVMLAKAGRHGEAVADYTAALKTMPRNRELLGLRAIALTRLRRYQEALVDCDAAIALEPNLSSSHFSRAFALDELGLYEEAIAAYDKTLALQTDDGPEFIQALTNRSAALVHIKRFDEAVDGLKKIMAIDPDHIYAFGAYAHTLLFMCDWSARDEVEEELRERILAAKSEIPPGTAVGYLDDPAMQLACAKTYVGFNARGAESAYKGPAYAHDRIRVAYLSADLYEHATARLAVEMFERHDKSRFEVTAISFGQNDGSAMRARSAAAFSGFYDVRIASDDEIVALMRRLEIGVAVDLKGFTAESRVGVIVRRPSPVQVNFLGFPGSLGGAFWDYILADKTVAPFALQPAFAEKIVHLPASYQPNDSRRPVPADAPTRAVCGLPETGFVFCCFNNNFKIAPVFFDVWMRLLQAVDGSVIWLIDDNAFAVANLKKEAAKRGVDPARLVFAPRVGVEAHLARHAHADLFLDTAPYGAHTTASDALWMGVPVVTYLGKGFAGRVGASLCRATGLDDLVVEDLAAYEKLARDLAGDPARLGEIRARLVADRYKHPLFDAAAYTRGVEAAYTEMWRRYRAGEAPAPFAV